MSDKTITSANAVFLLTESNFYSAGIKIQGFAADAAFAVASAPTAETQMGVDGNLSAGWVPREYKQTWSLQADSESIAVFDAIANGQDAVQDIFWLQGVMKMKSIGRSYTFTKGVLTEYKVMPDGKKILQPVEFVITWQSVKPAILS